MKPLSAKRLLILLLSTALALPGYAQDSLKRIRISDNLEIVPLSPRAYLHVSWTTQPEYGRFTNNGLIYINGNEAVVFDTPPDDSLSHLLLNWFAKTFPGVTLKAVIATHFHSDCLGGLKTFHANGITSYAYHLTNALIKSDTVERPQKSFTKTLRLRVGKEFIRCEYYGEGHSRDNIVGWVPAEKILFGGCMIKAMDAGRGYLGDANLSEWSNTVKRVRSKHGMATIVIPGHGNYGGPALLDYTIKMFEKEAR